MAVHGAIAVHFVSVVSPPSNMQAAPLSEEHDDDRDVVRAAKKK